MERINGFEPIVDTNSKILILGSMPSVASLEGVQYYAHPQNRFWKIMFDLFHEYYCVDYSRRVDLLARHNVALWDSIASCSRSGSLDSAIKNAIPNDVSGLLDRYPNIKMVFTNGKKADKTFVRYNPNTNRICLPSTSPANAAYSYDKLFSIWKESINRFI